MAWMTGGPLVLLLAYRLGVGGMTRYLAEHAEELSRRGFRLRLLTSRSPGVEKYRERFGAVCDEVVTYERLWGYDVWREVRRCRPALVRLVNGKAPADSRLAWGFVLPGARGVPLVESVHLPSSRRGLKVGQRGFHLLRPRIRYRALAFSWAMYEEIRRQTPRLPAEHLRYGLTLPEVGEVERVELDGLKLVSVCRLHEKQKDIATLLRAVRVLADEGRAVTLDVYGEGRSRGDLEALSAELGLRGGLGAGVEGPVRFLGWAEDPVAAIAGADVFVNATKMESFGRTNVEAAAAGVAVVCSDAPGCDESVGPENGVLVPIGDVDALAGALRELIDDPERRRAMGEAGRGWARTFSMARHTDEVLRVAGELGAAGLAERAKERGATST